MVKKIIGIFFVAVFAGCVVKKLNTLVYIYRFFSVTESHTDTITIIPAAVRKERSDFFLTEVCNGDKFLLLFNLNN